MKYMHRKGTPKMIKDLKFGNNVHLRQSLLDISQIQNLNKIFAGRKDHYHIEDQPVQPSNRQKQNSQQQKQLELQKAEFFLSPQQNLQLIKRQRNTNKIKEKMSQMFQHQQVRKYKMRKPVLYNLLQQFKESYRVQEQPKYRQALKNSQKNLQHIKINTKKRVSSQYIRGDMSVVSRAKFVSISTGKPVVTRNSFPSFADFVQGKHKVKQKPSVSIDINKMDNFFNTMITQPNMHGTSQKNNAKQDYLKYVNRAIMGSSINRSQSQSPQLKIDSRVKTPLTNYNRTAYQNKKLNRSSLNVTEKKLAQRKVRLKSAMNPSTNFTRSQESSRKIISAMQTYYQVKKKKTQECDSIVGYLRKDRPLTSQIRRKNYNLIGNDNIQNLNKYRQRSQEQRVRILERNYQFYISLLRTFEHCKEEQIRTSICIFNRLKEYFENEYIIFQQDAKKICQLIHGQKPDFGVNIIRQNLMEYAKKEQNLLTQNQADYELL